MNILKILLSKLLAFFNYEIKRIDKADKNNSQNLFDVEDIFRKRNILLKKYEPYLTLDDLTKEEIDIIHSVEQFTMTGPMRIVSLIRSVEYIIKNNIPGDFVECGVWKGGSMMTIALTLKNMGVTDRDLYLYDTFEGMVEPSDSDFSFKNEDAKQLLEEARDGKEDGNNIWCYSSISEVQGNMATTGYDLSRIHYIPGMVEKTLNEKTPNKISLLRLDTDWYNSTIAELTTLYPLLSKNGVLIIDDYGQWLGQKKAVDEYISKNNLTLFLSRIDSSSRIVIKN